MYEWTNEDRDDYRGEQREQAGRDEEIGQELERRAAALAADDEDECPDSRSGKHSPEFCDDDSDAEETARCYYCGAQPATSPLAIANAWAAALGFQEAA
jgi:hypothetical protein